MASGEAKKIKSGATQEAPLPAYARVASVAPAHQGRSVRVDRIIVRNRLRPTTPGKVEAKRVSMRESGQISPIIVRPSTVEGEAGLFILVAGAHRLEAAILEGWTEILADVRVLTDDQAELVEIDENLISAGLTPYERALFVSARLRVWAKLHPERIAEGKLDHVDPINAPLAIKRGRPAKADRMAEFLGDTPATMGFSAETASDLGISAVTVKRALAVARGLSPAVHAKVSGSKLGKNEGLLRQIAGVADPAEQLRIVEALTDGRATKFADAQVYATGKTPTKAPERPVDEAVKAFKKVWKAAPKTHRDAMLHWLSGEALPTGWNLVKGGDDD